MLSGSPVAGFPVGILCLRTCHPLLPGNVQNAQSFSTPVLYHAIDVTEPWALMRGDPALTDIIVAGVQHLASHGVRGVAGACGSFAFYQRAVAERCDVPVFLSILTQVPFILQSLGPRRKLGVICAVAETMNARVYGECGIRDPHRLFVVAMRGRPAFDVLIEQNRLPDPARLRAEVLDAAAEICADPDVGAILLQCSELPPYAADIQARCGLPVFDMTILIRWLSEAADRRPYAGIGAGRAT